MTRILLLISLILMLGSVATAQPHRLERALEHLRAQDWPRALQAPLDVGAAGFEQIWVASVAGAEADERIGALIEARTGVPPRFYYSRQEDFGVSNCYPEPRRLGVDRWVALVECWQRFGAGIIIDCGSALTIDAIDGEGRFLGGYIVPGLGMLRR